MKLLRYFRLLLAGLVLCSGVGGLSVAWANQFSVTTAPTADFIDNNDGTVNTLSLSCPTILAAGASGTCSATANYSDGTSKAVSPVWSTSDAATLLVGSGGSYEAQTRTVDTAAMISADYSENEVHHTSTAAVTVKAAITPSADFIDNQDGTVTHKITGLTWKRCAEGQSWSGTTCIGAAQYYLRDVAMALGSNGWRVPTKGELLSIIDMGHDSPAINETIFPKTPVASPYYDHFWTSSAHPNGTSWSWVVTFINVVTPSSAGGLTAGYPVRLVRTVSLNALTLICPATLASTANGTCSATASYSDGTTKAVRPTWSSSDATALSIDSNGSLAAGIPATDTVATISASYSENGVSETVTAAVTVKAVVAAATLTSLSAACPSTITAGTSAICSTIANYNDGSSKVVNATWTSGNTSVATVSGLTVTANAGITTDTPVLLNANYSENGVSKTANANVTVTVSIAQATNACTGTDRYLTGITIAGGAAKKVGDTLDVNYCLKNFSKVSRFDIYVAVKVPDNSLLYMKSSGFFGSPIFNSSVTPYLKNTLLPDLSGPVLSMPELPLELPLGSYTFYAVPVLTGKSVENTANWIGQISQGTFTLSW